MLTERLAVGGMAEVYLASAGPDRPLQVVKVLLENLREESDFVKMFEDEGRIGLLLAHPNIVGTHEAGRVDEIPFLAMEYVEGENLRTVLSVAKEKSGVPAEIAARIAIGILLGLDHAHRARDGNREPLNLVHRDLSPDNVLLSWAGEPKILDFGIAKASGRLTRTQVGVLKGKALYMAPEQAHAGELDLRVDIFAAGLVLLEMVTGRRRFEFDDPVRQLIAAQEWRGAPEVLEGVPPELARLIARAVEREPDARFPSAEAFAAALTRVVQLGQLPKAAAIAEFLESLFRDRPLRPASRALTPRPRTPQRPGPDPTPVPGLSRRSLRTPLPRASASDDPTRTGPTQRFDDDRTLGRARAEPDLEPTAEATVSPVDASDATVANFRLPPEDEPTHVEDEPVRTVISAAPARETTTRAVVPSNDEPIEVSSTAESTLETDLATLAEVSKAEILIATPPRDVPSKEWFADSPDERAPPADLTPAARPAVRFRPAAPGNVAPGVPETSFPTMDITLVPVDEPLPAPGVSETTYPTMDIPLVPVDEPLPAPAVSETTYPTMDIPLVPVDDEPSPAAAPVPSPPAQPTPGPWPSAAAVSPAPAPTLAPSLWDNIPLESTAQATAPVPTPAATAPAIPTPVAPRAQTTQAPWETAAPPVRTPLPSLPPAPPRASWMPTSEPPPSEPIVRSPAPDSVPAPVAPVAVTAPARRRSRALVFLVCGAVAIGFAGALSWKSLVRFAFPPEPTVASSPTPVPSAATPVASATAARTPIATPTLAPTRIPRKTPSPTAPKTPTPVESVADVVPTLTPAAETPDPSPSVEATSTPTIETGDPP